MTDEKPKDIHKWMFEDPDVLNLTMKIPNFADRVSMRKIILKAEQQGFEQGKLAELKRVESRWATIYGSKRTMEEVVFAFDDWLKSQLKDGEKR
jgi:hypothetical protein